MKSTVRNIMLIGQSLYSQRSIIDKSIYSIIGSTLKYGFLMVAFQMSVLAQSGYKQKELQIERIFPVIPDTKELLLKTANKPSEMTCVVQPETIVYEFTGSMESLIIPEGVVSISIEAHGAQGANATGGFNPGTGGLGGSSFGKLSVFPGDVLNIFVGGQNGYNGGGAAGGHIGTGTQTFGGNGGGASDIRLNSTDLSSRIIVAAGGGGAAGSQNGTCSTGGPSIGGAGGSFIGVNGNSGTGCGGAGGAGGGGIGASQISGGSGGTSGINCTTSTEEGGLGAFGAGGNGGNGGNNNCDPGFQGGPGGGGGGGFYGGGGGGAGAGGIGGSWSGGGGGGGSSYIEGLMESNALSGNWSGNGRIIITLTFEDVSPIVFVDSSNTSGIENGNSWASAFINLQDALTYAEFCSEVSEIWVAKGTYFPTNDPTDRNATFQLLNGVALYGGFNGAEVALEQRDWTINQSVLSGDIDQNGDLSGNSFSVVTGSGTNNTARIDGFTITGGNANDTIITPATISGGGIFNSNGSPGIFNNLIVANQGLYGGGIANLFGSNPQISNNIFEGNSALTVAGGGIFNQSSSPEITNNHIVGNFGIWGGGIANLISNPLIANNLISGNTAMGQSGGGIYNQNSGPVIKNNTIQGNIGTFGGGITNITECNPIIINNSISGNRGLIDGGAIRLSGNSNVTISNSIIWNNSSGNSTTDPGASVLIESGSSAYISNSLVANSGGSGSGWQSVLGEDGGNNLELDPLFVENINLENLPTSEGDLRLTGCSPAINSGSNEVLDISDTVDLDGNPRIFDGTVDMGAYELQSAPTPVVAICQNQTIALDINGQAMVSALLLNNSSTGCGELTFSVDGNETFSFTCEDVGPNDITLVVTDSRSITSSCQATVTINDQAPPSISCPATQSLVLDADCSASLPDYTALATPNDNCGVQGVTQSPIAGTIVSDAGNMTVTLTVTDVNGQENTCNFMVSKVDNTPPSISCPDAQTLVLDEECSASLPDYTALATSDDNCGVLGVTQSPLAGINVSDAGNMTLSLTVTDVNGLSNNCSFTVTKVDNTPPSLECFNQNISFNGEDSIPLSESELVEADDNCGIQSITLSPNSISGGQVGQTVPVLVTVTDINNNSSNCTSYITVGGLPPGWSQNINGIGCSNGNDIQYNPTTEVWTATSTNCFYSSPFTSDAAAFAQRALCGDGSITTQVTGISGTALGWAGVVMRESNAGGAKKAQLTTNMAGNQSRREFRVTTNGAAMPQNFPAQNRYWLRVVRSGNQFIMYNSPNGAQWYLVGAQTIAMGNCIEIGLVATNYANNSTVISTFANVSYTGSGPFMQASLPENNNLAALANIQPDFSVYPNPTSGELNIDLKEFMGKNVQIELFSLEGKLMQLIQLDEVLQNTQTMLLERYASGMYFVKLKSEGVPDVTKRVVLTKS